MKTSIRFAALAAAFAVALPLAANAASYETATFVDESVAAGDYAIDNTRFLGAAFAVGSGESLTSVGGNFTLYGDGGSLFAAVLDSKGTVLFETTFVPTGGDQSVALTGALSSGHYTVVFGSGLYGADGYSGLVGSQGAVGAPSFVQYAGTLSGASVFTDDALRVTMETASISTVPESGTALLFASGTALLGFAARRRAR